eukprot:3715978-Rhodomonas_salina.1
MAAAMTGGVLYTRTLLDAGIAACPFLAVCFALAVECVVETEAVLLQAQTLCFATARAAPHATSPGM